LLQNNIPNTDRIAEQIVVWAFEAQRQIGTGAMFMDLEKTFDAGGKKQFRLPNEVYDINDIDIAGGAIYTGFPKKNCSTKCSCNCSPCDCMKWYQSGRYLNFSKKVNDFKLVYRGIATDDDGFPMIDEQLIDAISTYVDYMLLYIRWKENKTPSSTIQMLRRHYLSKFRAARALSNLPSEAEARTISRIMNSKLPVLTWEYQCVGSDGCTGSVCETTTTQIINNITQGGGEFTCLDAIYGDGSTTYTFTQLVDVPQNNILLYLDGTLAKDGQEIVGYNESTGEFTLNGGYDGLEIRVCYYPN
jgi:hypothetical protein